MTIAKIIGDRESTEIISCDVLDRFLRPGVKLDFSHLPNGHVVLKFYIVDDSAKVVAKMRLSGGLDARNDSHCRYSFF